MNGIKKYCGILLLLILFGGLLSSNLRRPNTNYISIEYSYDHTEKPIPQIVFYTDTFVVDEITFVGYRFKIKKQEFVSVENVIKNKSSYIIVDSTAQRYFSFNVAHDRKKTVYGTVNRNKTKTLFDNILGELRSLENYSEINKAFDQLYSQLTPRGNKLN